MLEEYKEYKRIKAKLRLLEVLISKQDSSKSIWKCPFAHPWATGAHRPSSLSRGPAQEVHDTNTSAETPSHVTPPSRAAFLSQENPAQDAFGSFKLNWFIAFSNTGGLKCSTYLRILTTQQFKIPLIIIYLWSFTDNRTCVWFQNTTNSTARGDIDFYRLFSVTQTQHCLCRNPRTCPLPPRATILLSSFVFVLQHPNFLSFGAKRETFLIWFSGSALLVAVGRNLSWRTGVFVHFFISRSHCFHDSLWAVTDFTAWLNSALHWHVCAYPWVFTIFKEKGFFQRESWFAFALFHQTGSVCPREARDCSTLVGPLDLLFCFWLFILTEAAAASEGPWERQSATAFMGSLVWARVVVFHADEVPTLTFPRSRWVRARPSAASAERHFLLAGEMKAVGGSPLRSAEPGRVPSLKQRVRERVICLLRAEKMKRSPDSQERLGCWVKVCSAEITERRKEWTSWCLRRVGF